MDPRLTDRRQRAMAAHAMTADARTAPRFRVASAPLPRVRATVRPPAVTRCCASNQRGMGCGSTSDQMWWQLGTRARMAPMGADAGGEARARRRRSDGCTPRPSSPSDRLSCPCSTWKAPHSVQPRQRAPWPTSCAVRRSDLFRRLASQAGEEVFRRVVRTRTHAPAPRSDDQTWIHIPSPACSRAADREYVPRRDLNPMMYPIPF